MASVNKLIFFHFGTYSTLLYSYNAKDMFNSDQMTLTQPKHERTDSNLSFKLLVQLISK